MRIVILLLALLASAIVTAESVITPNTARSIVQSMEDSLNDRDWRAFGSKFSEDGDLILFGSRRAVGPSEVEELIGNEWAETPPDVTANLNAAEIRVITTDVAIVSIEAEFSGSPPSKDRAILVIRSGRNGSQIEALRVFNAEGM